MRIRLALVVGALALGMCSCATYLDDLNRAEAHCTSSAPEPERALALFRVDEPDLDSFNHEDHARYAYLRGMNDYRLGGEFRPDARHWLAYARALEKIKPGGLKPEWKERIDTALKDLNRDVYGQGAVAEAEQPKEPSGAAKAKETPPSSADSDKMCRKDADCPGDQICVRGSCKTP